VQPFHSKDYRSAATVLAPDAVISVSTALVSVDQSVFHHPQAVKQDL
jgi:hypothetical protein